MNENPEPSKGNHHPYVSQASELGSALLTQVTDDERPFFEADLAQTLLQGLEGEWPEEPALVYPSEDGRNVNVAPIGKRIVVGRSPEDDVSIRSDHLSRGHFEITCENGECHLRDRKSRNGTWVKGMRWDDTSFEERGLRPGDCIQAGGVSFVFWSGGG